MRVRLSSNPKKPTGFAIQFPYDPVAVEKIKRCLAPSWEKSLTSWITEGPEVLLDMQRFGIEIEWISDTARTTAERFRQEVWDAMDARVQDIEGEEYGFQKQGADFLASMHTAILGDDMGTGKTKQSLDAAAKVSADSILVLAPKTLLYNWREEVIKWHPEFSVGVLPDHKDDSRKNGPGRDSFWVNPPQIVIANYEKLRAEDFRYDYPWDIVICDEATKLKNSQTAVYKNVKRVVKRLFLDGTEGKHSWALTGTPLEIRLMELYNIFQLLRPALLGNYMRFKDQHLITDWAGTVVGARNIELLRERIAPFILRRTKAEVLPQLPGKVYTNAFVKMSPGEQEAYDQMTSMFNNWLTQHGVSGGGDPLVQTLRMRQFCCSPMLFTEELGKGSKFAVLEEILDEWPGQAVIFCFFEEMISYLGEWLRPNPRALISGKVSSVEERLERVKDFNAGKLGKVFLSTDAGNVGLNMTGADMIVHYDQIFNPQRMHQREDRLDRIGQVNKVNVVNLLCLDTIDYGMYQLNIERDELFKEVIDGAEEAILRKLDAPRLRRLVEGRLNSDEPARSWSARSRD